MNMSPSEESGTREIFDEFDGLRTAEKGSEGRKIEGERGRIFATKAHS